ncbi:MAG TPA: prolipoprotein diacylglyceryl transferase family protein, partial [Thermoanaerobaculia bacterium]|nr:prolipoprotein diacylglyceryl transferase family protein [Thermoanaerobaculia bacterium]
ACLAIWVFGIALLRRRPAPGVTAMAVLALLAGERFLIELLRAKDDRFLGVMTVAQAISVAVLLVAVALLVQRRRARPARDG